MRRRSVTLLVVSCLIVGSCTPARYYAASGVVVGTTGALLVTTSDPGTRQRVGGAWMIGYGAYALLMAGITTAAEHMHPRHSVDPAAASGTAPSGAPAAASDDSYEPAVMAPSTSHAADVSCSFGDCTKHGSTARTPAGDVETRCAFGDCTKNGWTTRHADGTSTDTRCSFGDCTKNGWSTNTSTTQCSFGDCTSNGWRTTSPDGTSSDTRCKFGDCNKNGWETTSSDGKRVECTCKFGNCAKHGVDCR